MLVDLQTHRFGVYSERPAVFAPSGVPLAEADSASAARLARQTLVQDAIDAGEDVEPLGIWDSDARSWVLWAWGCGRCRMTSYGPLCATCQQDATLGESRVSRREEEEEARRGREADEADGWEPRWIP